MSESELFKRMFLFFGAWVCVQCDEVYFEATEIEAIQEIILTIEQQTPEMMLVPA